MRRERGKFIRNCLSCICFLWRLGRYPKIVRTKKTEDLMAPGFAKSSREIPVDNHVSHLLSSWQIEMSSPRACAPTNNYRFFFALETLIFTVQQWKGRAQCSFFETIHGVKSTSRSIRNWVRAPFSGFAKTILSWWWNEMVLRRVMAQKEGCGKVRAEL